MSVVASFLVSLGLKPEELILPGIMVFSMTLGLIYRLGKPSEATQIALNLAFGLCAACIAFPLYQVLVIVGTASVGYLISTSTLPAMSATVITLAVLAVFHVERMTSDYMTWSYDFTGPLMLVVVRVSMFSFDLFDGQHRESVHHDSQSAIRENPGFVVYMSYVLNVFTLIAGPCFTFSQYRIGLTAAAVGSGVQTRLPRAALNVVVAVLLGKVQNSIGFLEPRFWWSSDFMDLSVFSKVANVYLVLLVVRMRYYLAWNLAEIACSMAGYSPNGEGSNADMFTIELQSTSIAQAVGRWNKTVSHWLKHYIYRRAGFKHKTNNMILTRAVSAFWHGFYPGYYLTFLFLVLGDLVEGVGRRLWGASLSDKYATRVWKIAHWIAGICAWGSTFFSLSYYGAPFFVLSLEHGLEIWSRMSWIGHTTHLAILAINGLVARPKRD